PPDRRPVELRSQGARSAPRRAQAQSPPPRPGPTTELLLCRRDRERVASPSSPPAGRPLLQQIHDVVVAHVVYAVGDRLSRSRYTSVPRGILTRRAAQGGRGLSCQGWRTVAPRIALTASAAIDRSSRRSRPRSTAITVSSNNPPTMMSAMSVVSGWAPIS